MEFNATVTLTTNDVEFVAADTLAANYKGPTAVVTFTINNEKLVAADTLTNNQEEFDDTIALATTKTYVNVELAEKDHIVKNV